MADIIVDTYKLDRYAQRIAAVNSRISRLDRRLDSLYWRVGLQGLWNLMQADALTCYSWRLSRCQSYLQQTALDFEGTERLILGEDPTNFNGVSVGDIINAYGTTASNAIERSGLIDKLEELISTTKPYVIPSILNMVSPVTGLLYLTSGVGIGNVPSFTDPSRKPSASANAEWLGYELADGNPGITAWLGKASAEAENEWGYAGVNAYLGKAEAAADADFAFMETKKKKEYVDGKWVEKTVTEFIAVEASAGASVSVLAVDAEAGVGTDMLGAEISAEGSAGNAKAEVKGEFSITEDGVNANVGGEAMVSAVEGEAKGTINILGIEITGKIGGYAGAAGVEGKIGIEDNKFVMEGGVAALLGVSGGVEIGFNDEGWDNFTEGVQEGWNDFTDGVGEFVDFVTFWD